MTQQMEYIKTFFSGLGRADKQSILFNSNLTDREVDLLTKRFISGFSLKEIANEYSIEEDTVNKKQLKAVKKLYSFLKNS